MIDKNSRLIDVYNTSIGHDILFKLLITLKIDEKKIGQFPFSLLKLKHLNPFLSKELVNSLIDLVNSEQEVIVDDLMLTEKWWKQAIFYQIYPKSFCDSNNDGIGDLKGIISKLDYLNDLGIDCLWLSPIYDSPNDDNGYDIRDYKKIMEDMGDMDDFKELLNQCHVKGMKLIMDLVVNHTSDEHIWYQKALSGVKEYQDYYIFKDKPNNWKSFFSGSAWKYEEKLNKYVLHTFSKKQMDLNWENPKVRDEVIDIVKFYHEMGVDGFRLDVINLISKKQGLPDGNPKIGEMMEFTGIEHYYYGPFLHDYLKELKAKGFKPYDAFAVGETPGHGIEMGRLLTNETRKELDLVFSFDHLETPGHQRFDDYKYDLNYLKELLYKYNDRLTNGDWQALYLENHDNPRMVSKVIKDIKYRDYLAKMLLGILLTFKGTPFIFQGQELASINLPFKTIEDIKDVESINKYNELINADKSKEDAFKIILSGSRDHARNMINWNDEKHENGWIDDYTLNDGYSVKEQINNPESTINFLKQIINFRKNHRALIYGELKPIDRDIKNIMIFKRSDDKEGYIVEINLSEQNIKHHIKDKDVLISNYQDKDEYLRPYEFIIYKD